jgi:7-cyano-7-deazaguanine reductase
MDETPTLTHLGTATEYRYDAPDASLLEAFANPSPGATQAVRLLVHEFTALCPITGQPDYGTIAIDYVPGPRMVESKSLKLYLVGFRNHGAFGEALANRIADDLVTLLAPRWLRVRAEFRPRGGIAIIALAERVAPGEDPVPLRALAAGLAVPPGMGCA